MPMRQVFHEIEECRDTSTLRETLNRFYKSQGFGATAFAFASQSYAHGHDWTADGFPIRSLAEYRRERFDLINPVPTLVVEEGAPVIWSDARSKLTFTAEQNRMVRRLMTLGVKDGITIPTYGRKTRLAQLSIGQPVNDNVIADCDIPFLQAVAQFAHNRFDQITRPQGCAVSLSPREREILFWIANNKSNTDIATILNISPATVATHIRRLFHKLGSNSRTGALLQALQEGAMWL